MNVLLTMSYTNTMDDGTPPNGILVLASIVEKHHNLKVVFPFELSDFLNNKSNLVGIDLIGFSVNSFNWVVTKKQIQYINKQFPNITIVLGGPHATTMHKYCLEESNAHIVVRGEGEITFPELINVLNKNEDLNTVLGITYKNNNSIVVNNNRNLLSTDELNNLPIPAYNLIPPNKYEYIPFETSRGCRFKCTFCAIPFDGVRYFSYDKIVTNFNAIKKFSNIFSQKALFITDDSFTSDKIHCENVINLIAKSDFKVGCEARISEIIKNDLVDSFEFLDFYMLQVGVECGYDDGLKKVKKGLTVSKVAEFINLVAEKKFSRKIFWSFIIGFPWEDETDILNTINFAFECSYSTNTELPPQVNNFAPYPGTEILENYNKYNSTIENDFWSNKTWSMIFLGQTKISKQNRNVIQKYLLERMKKHPSLIIVNNLLFPDGKVIEMKDFFEYI